MTIPPNATQEELKKTLRHEMWRGIGLVSLAAVLLSPFCYLRCLLNPLWVLGLKVPGLFVTALFTCYVGWQYVQGDAAAGETALLWWAAWAGIMLIIHYILFSLTPFNLWRHSKKHLSPNTDKKGTEAPQQAPLHWQKNEQGFKQAEFILSAPVRGIYAINWALPGYTARVSTPEGAARPAISAFQAQENALTELYKLEPGSHRISLQLDDRDAPPPSSATLTQLSR